jgi:hypothetical protein
MLRIPETEEADRLRECFREADYSEKGIIGHFGTLEPPSPHHRSLPRLLDLTKEGGPRDLLLRWFLGNRPVAAKAARAALPEDFLDAALSCGLLDEQGDDLVPAALIVPVGDLLIAADTYERMGSEEGFDHVCTVSPSARYLADFSVTVEAEEALDLCCGNGLHALQAAAHCGRVLGTDLNERAVLFAALNARLNGAANVETLAGDGFAPVDGREFGYIVCNPPYVMAPSREYLYRDGNMELDGFVEKIARGAPRYLAEGGWFQMICEWVQYEGETWEEHVAKWFTDSGCDVWVLKNYTEDPTAYAHMRVRETAFASAKTDQANYDTWMEHYRAHRVEAMHGGLVTMRRRSGKTWQRLEDVAPRSGSNFGDVVLRGFAVEDFLQEYESDERIREARLRLAPDVRIVQELSPGKDEWTTTNLRFRQANAFRRDLGLDPDVARFLALFDGNRTLAELQDSLTSDSEETLAKVREESLTLVRLLVSNGYLVPA